MRGGMVFLLIAMLLALSPAVAEPRASTPPLILHSRLIEPDGEVGRQTWTEQTPLRARTLFYGPNGRVEAQNAVILTKGQIRTDNVDYGTRQWMTRTTPLPPNAYNVQVGDSQYFPAFIRKEVSQHLVGVIGHKLIDGKQTLHLQGQLGSAILEYWVMPKSYLVVRASQRQLGESANPGRLVFDWLPATHANEAKTKLQSPSGFQHTG